MRFGFTLPNNWGIEDPGAVAQLASQAESAGYDSVWVNHHVLNVGYVGDRLGDRPYHDALTMLTWAAATTSRVRLGTSVLVLPYLHPLVLAKAVATLDVLSGGRVDLGVGVGSLQVENDALGVVDYDRRGAYTNESLEVMIAAWTQTELAYSGEFFSFADAKASPKPLQRPHVPIHVGGNRPPALRRVAAYGQGWHPLGVSPEGLVERKARLVDELEARGRSIDEIHISIRADVDLRESPPGPDERPAPFRGTVEQLRESISRFAEAGAHEIVVSVGSPELARSVEVLERFADEVIPAFTS